MYGGGGYGGGGGGGPGGVSGFINGNIAGIPILWIIIGVGVWYVVKKKA